jgi:hypothetical protein
VFGFCHDLMRLDRHRLPGFQLLWWGGIHVKGNWNMIMEGFKRPKKKKKTEI